MTVSHLNVDLVVARTAEGHEVRPVMSPATADGNDVVHLFHQGHPAFLETHLTEGMLLCVAVAYPFPGTTVLPVYIRRALIFVVLTVHFFSVLFAVLPVREPGASRVGARSFRFCRHFFIFFPVSLAM